MRSVQFSIIIIIITIVLITFLFTGCWDRNEPENRAFVIATGFDYDQNKDLYEITIQVANPMAAEEQGTNGAGGNSGGASILVISAKGVTPYHASRNLFQNISREPYFGHNRIVIITERLARKGLGPIYDFFERERQSRVISEPIILEDGRSITEFFRTETPLEEFAGEGIEKQIRLSAFQRSIFPDRTLIEILVTSALVGREILIGRVILGPQTEEDRIAEEKPAVRETIKFEGAAAFVGDKMKGWLDAREVRGWFWVHERIHRAIITFKCPVHDEHPIALEVHEASSQMEPIITEENQPRVKIKILAEARIQDQTCPASYLMEGEKSASLRQRLATVIENDIKQSIEVSKHLGSDYLGFGNLFYRKMPDIWREELSGKWQETLKTLPVDLEVETIIRRTGLINKPFIRE